MAQRATERSKHDAEWRSYQDRKGGIKKHRVKAFSIISGQCQKVLIDKIKLNPDWEISEHSGNPLLLIQVTEKRVLSQTEDIYPFASVYEQERTLYTSHHNYLTNDQWHEKFNTRSDVANSIRVTRQHKALLEHMSQEKHSDSFEKSQEKNKKQ